MSDQPPFRRRRPPFPLIERQVSNWQAEHNIGDFDTAELDLRLEWAIHTIYSDAEIQTRLAWKGGTAINKLFLAGSGQYRLSVDLDFNAVGSKDEVVGGERRRQLRERVAHLLSDLDALSRVAIDHPTWAKDEIRWYYHPIASPDAEAFVKLEISTTERFSIIGFAELPVLLAGVSEPTMVQTLPLDELVATKIRAFFERRKGRDVYDIYRVFENHALDQPRLRKMILYYFYRAGHEFRSLEFFSNIEKKLADPGYGAEISLYLRTDEEFDWLKATQRVRQHLAFLGDLDERDGEFLLLARYLIGRDALPAGWSIPKPAQCPIRWLFDRFGIHPNSQIITLEDIRIQQRPDRPVVQKGEETESGENQ